MVDDEVDIAPVSLVAIIIIGRRLAVTDFFFFSETDHSIFL